MVVIIRKKFKPAQHQQRRLLLAGGVLSLVALSMLGISIAYLYTPHRITPCGLVGDLCVKSSYPPPPPPLRTFSDEEVASRAVAKDILSQRRMYQGGTPKIAFMFLTPGPLPFEFIWEAFFKVLKEFTKSALDVLGTYDTHFQFDLNNWICKMGECPRETGNNWVIDRKELDGS